MSNLKTKIGLKKNLDKLLFLFATIYLMFVGGWFWKQQQNSSNASISLSSNKNDTSENLKADSLEKEIKNNASSTNNQINLPSINESSISLPTPISSLPSPPIDNIPSANSLTIPPLPNNNISGNNLLPPPPSVSVLPIPQPPQPTLSSTPPSPSITPKPLPSKTKLTKVPTITSLTTNVTNENKIINANNNIISHELSKKTNNNYILMGILELENSNSIALFNVNNITEKVNIGSEIGTTGWVLMAVNEKQVVITRQNQSVYLRVGETF